MLNQAILVGRLVNKPEVKEREDGKKFANITLAVPRNYKNEEGQYDTDFIDCLLWHGIAENTAEWCNKGDLVGIKGRIETMPKIDKDDFQNGKEIVIIAEKVTFLSSKRVGDK